MVSYSYTDSQWKDLLTAYNGSAITYDAIGNPLSYYNGVSYYYYHNLQGDVIGIYNQNLNKVVGYSYDSWGKLISITGSMADTLGVDNPFRYRGYYYDTDLQWSRS